MDDDIDFSFQVTYEVKINILDSIVLAYETRDINKEGLKLTEIYIRKIHSFCRLLRHKDRSKSIRGWNLLEKGTIICILPSSQ